MQFSNAVILSVASLLASASAENIVVALKEDIQGNVNQYLSFVQANTQADVAPLLSLYQAAQTYTDDSYTTLVDQQELASLSAFATALPWYSSRIEPKVDEATPATSSAAASSTEASSSVPASSTEASSSAPASSSTEASSSAPITSATSATSSAPASSEAPVTSSSGNSTTASSSVSTAGAAAFVAPGAGLALALGAVALL